MVDLTRLFLISSTQGKKKVVFQCCPGFISFLTVFVTVWLFILQLKTFSFGAGNVTQNLAHAKHRGPTTDLYNPNPCY